MGGTGVDVWCMSGAGTSFAAMRTHKDLPDTYDHRTLTADPVLVPLTNRYPTVWVFGSGVVLDVFGAKGWGWESKGISFKIFEG